MEDFLQLGVKGSLLYDRARHGMLDFSILIYEKKQYLCPGVYLQVFDRKNSVLSPNHFK